MESGPLHESFHLVSSFTTSTVKDDTVHDTYLENVSSYHTYPASFHQVFNTYDTLLSQLILVVSPASQNRFERFKSPEVKKKEAIGI